MPNLFLDFSINLTGRPFPMTQVLKFGEDRKELCIMSTNNYTLIPLVIGAPDNYRYTDSAEHP